MNITVLTEKLKDYSLKVDYSPSKKTLRVIKGTARYAEISEQEVNILNTNFSDFKAIKNIDDQTSLFMVLIEYATTPLANRVAN